MAVGENTGGVDLGANAGSSSQDIDAGGAPELNGPNDLDARQAVVRMVETAGGIPVLRSNHEPAAASAAYHMRVQQFNPQHRAAGGILEKGLARSEAGVVVAQRADGVVVGRKGDAVVAVASGGGEGFRREIRDLEELLSKLNPMAAEFVPTSLANHRYAAATGGGVGSVDAGFDSNGFGAHHAVANGGVNGGGRRRVRVLITSSTLFSFLFSLR